MKWPSKPSYLLKTKKSDDPSAKLTFTDGFALVDLSSISEKEIFPKVDILIIFIYYMKHAGAG